MMQSTKLHVFTLMMGIVCILTFTSIYAGINLTEKFGVSLEEGTTFNALLISNHNNIVDVVDQIMCSPNELEIIQEQLPAEECLKTKDAPWRNKCSFTYETRCPDPGPWLRDYYTEYHQSRTNKTQPSIMTGLRGILARDNVNTDTDRMIGISVGCNKAMDAVDTLRMITNDAKIDKEAWRGAFLGQLDNELAKHKDIVEGRCGQMDSLQFQLPGNDNTKYTTPHQGEMYCVEPMPATNEVLENAANSLNWKEKGFTVVPIGIARQDSEAVFPTTIAKKNSKGEVIYEKIQPGHENKGMFSCKGQKIPQNLRPGEESNQGCINVQVLTLDNFALKYIPDFDNVKSIKTLSIDVEGYDFDVMLGGVKVLEKVEYLEFEYNWMGSWGKQKLEDAIKFLDGLDFTCYWAGQSKLWKITGCFLEFYEASHWSNVGCANRRLNPVLWSKMENVYKTTLGI